MTLETSIEYVKGIGPDRAKLIKGVLGLSTVEDLLNFYPIRYLDKNKVYKISQLEESAIEVQLKGRITQVQEVQTGKTKRLSAKFNDDTGTMDLVWFQYSKWLKEQIPANREVIFSGRSMFLTGSFPCLILKLKLKRIKKTTAA
ncbi:ATP-dependent DNA helicase RecG [Chryseobacterium oranimense G311]|nr:ATP-dependent DNA helicase RecG [Chryseobacterium oranimense G311]